LYEFIDRMETKGIIQNVRDGIRPFSREKAAQLLIKLGKNKAGLTKIENEELQWFREELYNELGHLEADLSQTQLHQLPSGSVLSPYMFPLLLIPHCDFLSHPVPNNIFSTFCRSRMDRYHFFLFFLAIDFSPCQAKINLISIENKVKSSLRFL